jgi:F420H(2)-dependent quinone reductase
MADAGEYVPSPWEWVRDQVEEYERSGGRRANAF